MISAIVVKICSNPVSQRLRNGLHAANNHPTEVIRRQVRNYYLYLDTHNLQQMAKKEEERRGKKALAAFVEDNLVIMGLMATLPFDSRHICPLRAALASS